MAQSIPDSVAEKLFLRKLVIRYLKSQGVRFPIRVPISIRPAPLTHPREPLKWIIDMPIVPPHLHDAVDSLFMWLAREFEAVPGITPRETSYFIFVDVDKVREKMRLGG